MKRLLHAFVGLTAVVSMFLWSCDKNAVVKSYLIVAPAERQPETPALGTLVMVQQHGGAELQFRVKAGKIELSTDASDSSGTGEACVAVPPDDVPLYVNIVPKDVEAELFVDLLGPQQPGTNKPCSGSSLQHQALPITTERENPTSAGDEGGGGAGGMGGAGGVGGMGGAAGAGGMP